MKEKHDNKGFWNRYAGLYDFEIKHFNGNAYAEMYVLMSSSLSSDMDVLEVATGTGLIALGIAEFAGSIEATDFSPKMVEAAMRKETPKNVRFSIEDATALFFEMQHLMLQSYQMRSTSCQTLKRLYQKFRVY